MTDVQTNANELYERLKVMDAETFAAYYFEVMGRLPDDAERPVPLMDTIRRMVLHVYPSAVLDGGLGEDPAVAERAYFADVRTVTSEYDIVTVQATIIGTADQVSNILEGLVDFCNALGDDLKEGIRIQEGKMKRIPNTDNRIEVSFVITGGPIAVSERIQLFNPYS